MQTANPINFITKTQPTQGRYRPLDTSRYPRQRGLGPSVAELEKQMVKMPHLAGDIRHEDDTAITHECRDVRQVKIAAENLGRIPGPLEAFHTVVSGRFALWDLAGPAVLELAAPATIATMTIATLGFSKTNIAEMVQMLATGKIGKLSLLCSHYFRGTSGGIWEMAATELAKFPTSRFASVRNHAKIAAIQLTDGRTITMESSENLRSCRNVGFATIYGHPAVYEFHVGWISELFNVKGVHRDRG